MDQPTGDNDGHLPDHNAAQFPDYNYAQFPYDNTAQLPDHNHVQVPSHNDAVALDSTLGQYNFGDGDLSAAPGLDQTTTPAEDQFDFDPDHQGMNLPQGHWDPTYGRGSLLNHGQAPQQPFGDQMTNWRTPGIAPQPFFPAHRSPHTPAFHDIPVSIAPDQQNDPVGIETAQKSKPRKRKRSDEEQEAEEDEEEDKEANKKSKAVKGVETKARKEQDIKDRRFLIGLRDEAASRVYEIAAQHIPTGAERAVFEHEWNLMKERNAEIDRNTEEYITWNGLRPDRRQNDRAVPERQQEQD